VANTGPAKRIGHGMAFDEINKVTILFGGFDGVEKIFNDTWSWDGTGWIQLEDSAPDLRNTLAMCYDTVAKKIVLFGGFGGNKENEGDTWQWNGAAWTQITEIGPGPLSNHFMVSTENEVILFGGSNESFFNNTWQWNGLHWTQIQDMGPTPRGNFAMAYDSDRKKIVLFGGAGPDSEGLVTSFADTWEGFWRP
jgi:N-acetylneuraminic acid mutarotase